MDSAESPLRSREEGSRSETGGHFVRKSAGFTQELSLPFKGRGGDGAKLAQDFCMPPLQWFTQETHRRPRSTIGSRGN